MFLIKFILVLQSLKLSVIANIELNISTRYGWPSYNNIKLKYYEKKMFKLSYILETVNVHAKNNF